MSSEGGENSENILFSFQDAEQEEWNLLELEKQFQEFHEELGNEDKLISDIHFYNANYNIKQLSFIMEFYGFCKEKRFLKKKEMISYIMMFENNPENRDLVLRRKTLWFYLYELKNDKFMRRFLIY
jgi:hypothetical protein